MIDTLRKARAAFGMQPDLVQEDGERGDGLLNELVQDIDAALSALAWRDKPGGPGWWWLRSPGIPYIREIERREDSRLWVKTRDKHLPWIRCDDPAIKGIEYAPVAPPPEDER